MASEDTERVGELLIEEGIITQEELARAVAESGIKGTVVAAALEGCKHPRRQELAAFLATDFRLPKLADLRQVEFQADAVRSVSEEMARKHEVVPVARVGAILCVAKPNYYNRAAVQDLRKATGLKIKVLQADEGQVKAAIERIYGGAKIELPEPRPEQKDTRSRRTQPPPVPEKAVLDAVPLISLEDEPVATPAASQGAAVEVVRAVKVPVAEFQAEERSAYARLMREWEDLFVNGRPTSPIKMA
ncbi:MAG: hypothetical protein HYY16_09830 [Planctomycetes bacterium]|nr:hypothetical protein [Planctomycetota bacterium]